MLASLRWNIRNLTREAVARFRFGLVTWTPRGSWPAFHAYYPDGLGSFPDLTDLYRRWIWRSCRMFGSSRTRGSQVILPNSASGRAVRQRSWRILPPSPVDGSFF